MARYMVFPNPRMKAVRNPVLRVQRCDATVVRKPIK